MSTTLCAAPALWSRLLGARLDPGLQPHCPLSLPALAKPALAMKPRLFLPTFRLRLQVAAGPQPRLPRRRAPSLPPAGSLGPSSARPTCSASLASSRCSASEPRLRTPRPLLPPRFSPPSATSPRHPFPRSQRRSRWYRPAASARLAATTPARLQPSPHRPPGACSLTLASIRTAPAARDQQPAR